MRAMILAAALLAGSAATATTVSWADWTAYANGSAAGVINAPGGPVNVVYAGGYSFVQTGCGTAYWAPGNYNGALNQPDACDIVALNAGGTKTITFDHAVTDPYLALQSWNGNTVTFSAPFTVESNGSGYWGSGVPVLNGDSTGFYGQGEVHAIIRFQGTFTSISFTDTSENWHGFTVGINDILEMPGGVPEPATWAMLIAGFGMVGFAARRRRMLAA